MLLRILVITLLVVVAVRLAARLAVELARRAAPPAPPPTPRNEKPRQLVRCPVCGDYFEKNRGLPAAAGRGGARLEVCSEECRARSAEGGR